MTRFQMLCALMLTGATCLAVDGTAHADDWTQATPVKGAGEFLRLDGIGGSSTDKSHTGWIEVSSFQWGVGRADTSAIGSATGGAGAGKVTIHDIRITKTLDSASPLLFRAAAAGGHLKTAQLDFVRADKSVVYQIKLTDVVISSYSKSSGGDRPTESLTLTFTKIEVTYTKQNADGTLGPTQPTPADWDLKANVKS